MKCPPSSPPSATWGRMPLILDLSTQYWGGRVGRQLASCIYESVSLVQALNLGWGPCQSFSIHLLCHRCFSVPPLGKYGISWCVVGTQAYYKKNKCSPNKCQLCLAVYVIDPDVFIKSFSTKVSIYM